jgi:hypothetical protein
MEAEQARKSQNKDFFGNDDSEDDAGSGPVILGGYGGNDTMAIFELDSNSIRGEGARCLAEGVKGSDSITELHLGDNDINMMGAQVL